MSDQVETLSQEAFIKANSDAIKLGELSPEYIKACRAGAAEGIVLLKNENNILPIAAKKPVSVFGRVQNDYFYVGYGSGGDVKTPYTVSLMEGLKASSHFALNTELAGTYAKWCNENVPEEGSWGKWPMHFEEMPLTDEIVAKAVNVSEVALVVIGRSAGEDRECVLEPGSFYLTEAEVNMLDLVTSHFDQVVVLINAGNTIDLSWVEKYDSKISGFLYAWQGGMESGNALADVLSGVVNPSGRLTSTFARQYEDYPSAKNFGGEVFNNYAEDIYVGYRYFETFAKDAVLYPFGYGLSYTDFSITATKAVAVNDEKVSVFAKVTNVGSVAGKQVVQVYYSAPQGVLGKPALELAGFAKTGLLAAGASEEIEITFEMKLMASYDDAGKTGYPSAYVLEPGYYGILIGSDVRQVEKVGVVDVFELIVCEQLSEAAAVEVEHVFDRLVADVDADGNLVKKFEAVPTRTVDLKERILAGLPTEIPTTDASLHFDDVVAGKATVEDFVATLNMDALEALTRGDYMMDSPLGAPGNAGVFGGVIESLRDKGVMPLTAADGPSGIRLKYECALLPCGVALASTWNTPLMQELATFQGAELTEKGTAVLLAPSMNMLRNPLCGRTFEYFSEDPVVIGRAAVAMVAGVQTHGYSACPKVFICNDQEEFRGASDSRISERALREIYLKGFEICLKEASPKNIMTAYNKVNGVHCYYHYELCTTILREEWGYEGNIVTDWWKRALVDPNFELLTSDAYRIRSGVNVLMPGGISYGVAEGDGSLLASYEQGGITLAEIQHSVVTVLKFILHVERQRRAQG